MTLGFDQSAARVSHVRIAARLDVKSPNVVKGIQLEGLRVVGQPARLAENYYLDGADEIIYQDVVASLYGRSSILEMVSGTATQTFVPLTVGGGLRSVEDVREALVHGADRVALNTVLFDEPRLVSEIARIFGSQCLSLSVEAKNNGNKSWECLTNCGRDRSGVDVMAWVEQCCGLGAGEIILTSVDKDGMRSGFDLDLLGEVRKRVDVPVMIHGGGWTVEHVLEAWECGASGVVLASALHYGNLSISELKVELAAHGVPVRP